MREDDTEPPRDGAEPEANSASRYVPDLSLDTTARIVAEGKFVIVRDNQIPSGWTLQTWGEAVTALGLGYRVNVEVRRIEEEQLTIIFDGTKPPPEAHIADAVEIFLEKWGKVDSSEDQASD